MQTFLPYKSFSKSAFVLDRQRLGKQRVEAYQIIKALRDSSYGWQNHPAVRMWRGHEQALALYGIQMCNEWRSRGYKDTMMERFVDMYEPTKKVVYPPFIRNSKFIQSHRSNLFRKNKEYYSQFKWNVSDDLPYIWPVTK